MLKLSDGPIKTFNGKENSQYLSKLGGRAGGGALSIKYLFSLEQNNALPRMSFFPSVFFSKAFQRTSKEVSRLCFPVYAYNHSLAVKEQNPLSQP